MPVGAVAATPEILVLSNRADLISGGDALIEIKWPQGANPATASVTLNGTPLTTSFGIRPNGRYMGLVTGLRDGANILLARYSGGAAQITITNHPIGGPVISGPQVQPWVCQTAGTAAGAGRGGPGGGRGGVPGPSLGPAVDAQCNAPTVFFYVYKTTGNQFAAYDPFRNRALRIWRPPQPTLV